MRLPSPRSTAALTAVFAVSVLLLAGCGSDGADPVPVGDIAADTQSDVAGDAVDTTDGDATGDTTDTPDGTDIPNPEPEVVACPTPLQPATPPGANVCAVEKGTGTGTLIVGDVLTPGRVYEGGGVLLDAKGMITCVGCDCAAGEATKVICPDAVVSPGLIDAHNHIGWLGDKPWSALEAKVDPKLRWEHRHEWRKGKNGHPSISTSGQASVDQKAWGELRYILTGGTAMFGSGDLSGLLRDLDATGSGKNGLNQPGAYYDTFPLGDSNGMMLDTGCGYPEIHAAPSSTVDAYVPHVAEGIDHNARNEFLCLTGQGDANAKNSLDGRASIIHGIGLRATEIAYMAAKGMKLVWSPRSNVSLYGDTAQVTLYARLGVAIGIGTDWVPSGSMNTLRELACADYLNQNHYGKYFTDEQLWRMATLNAAKAMAMDDAVGVLATGRYGDIAIYDRKGREPYRAVLSATAADMALVLRGGVAVAGNTAVVDALVSGCDEIGDICGQIKRVCFKRDIGKDWSALQKALGTPSYPAWACGDPEGEPTCVPERTLENDSVKGSTLYPDMTLVNDPDGDGIATDKDNCPNTFNPVRPVDDKVQPDTDGDGLGDVCDPCPFDANTTACKKFDPDDSDGDGLPTLKDNCPAKANADQANKDGDDKGDACDPCPDFANVGSVGCSTDLAAIKVSPATYNYRVSMSGMVVTAVGSNGWFMQKKGTPVEHGGVFVYVGTAGVKAKLGDIIDVTGATVTVYFDEVELTEPDWVATGETATPEAKVVSATELAAAVAAGPLSPWEATLMRVEGVTVVNADPAPGSGETDNANEFEIDASVRVDDYIWPTGTPFVEPWPVKGDVFPFITGPMAWRNGFLKVLPRDKSDFALAPADVQAFNQLAAFQRLKKSGPTLSLPLTVRLNHAETKDVTIEVQSDDPTIAVAVGSPLTVPAGQTEVAVPVQGLKLGETTLRAMLTGGENEATVQISVITDDALPDVLALDPPEAALVAGTTATFTVQLDMPAPSTGLSLEVTVSSDGADLIGTVSGAVIFEPDALSATFTFTAGSKPATGKLLVGLATEVSANITVLDASATNLDLSGWKVEQTASAKSAALPKGTIVTGGGYVIVARGATKEAFETFWKVTLAANVVFVNAAKDAGGEFPQINGDETFTLRDAAAKVIDGPTPALKAGDNLQRNVPVGVATDAASWKKGTSAPGSGATPGSGQGLAMTPNGAYISEIADPTGAGNYIYEFVEIHFDGPKP
jgi:hypothetical protein